MSCDNTDTVPRKRNGRIVWWEVVCPTHGLIASGRNLKDVIDTLHQHIEENQSAERHPPRKLGTVRLPI